MGDFDGKVMLVTGGGTGLGAAVAIGAARRGAKGRDPQLLAQRQGGGGDGGGRAAAGAEAVTVQGDVAKDADCRRIAAAAERFGKIDALVNSAGITKHVPRHAELDALSTDDFLRLYAVNTVGPFQMIRACRPPAGEGDGAGERADGVLDRRRARHRLVGGLRRLQGRAQHHDAVAGARAGAQDPRQRHLPGLHRHALVRRAPTTRRPRRRSATTSPPPRRCRWSRRPRTSPTPRCS